MGLQRERHIDTPPRGNMERVIPSVKQKTKDLLTITASIAVHHHGADLALGPLRELTSQLLRWTEPGRLLASGSSPWLLDACPADLLAAWAAGG